MPRKFIPQRKNANKHTQRGLKELENSIQRDGWIGAITVTADGETFDGSARLETLANVMPDKEPIVIDVDGHTPVVVRRTDIPNADDPRAKRLAVAANRIAQVDLDWDASVLADLAQQEGDLLAGLFNDDELAELIGQGEAKEETADAGELVDKAAQLQEKWQVQRGDVWEIGKHRLMCGDSTSAEDVATLMQGERAEMVFTDPPYGNKLGYGRGQLGERYIENDDSTTILNVLPDVIDSLLCENSHCLIWIQWRTFSELTALFQNYKLRTVVVWDKNNAGLSGGGFAEQHEWLCVFIKGKATQKDYSGNVWRASRENHFSGRVPHPTMKPVELIDKGLRLCSNVSDIIWDGFAGAGSTLVACEQTGRIGRGMEIEPKYCAVTLERLSLLGLTPKRAT